MFYFHNILRSKGMASLNWLFRMLIKFIQFNGYFGRVVPQSEVLTVVRSSIQGSWLSSGSAYSYKTCLQGIEH